MDSPAIIGAITFGLLILFLASGAYISVGVGLVGVVLLFFFVGGRAPQLIGVTHFNTNNIFTYTAIPLFIFMGEIVLRSGLGDRLYTGATPWVGFLPGGLLHTNIFSCAIFAAVTGSSVVCAATIGTAAIPELAKRGYSKRLTFGSLAAGGTLGIMIPPSLGFIIYGAIVQQSVGRLFLAGVFPGIIMALLFMAYIAVAVGLKPSLAPERLKFSPKALLLSVNYMWPVMLLMFMVVGTIYAGIATPTEAAALGAAMALLFAAVQRRLTWRDFKDAARSAVEMTSWIMLIVVGALIMGIGLSLLKVPSALTAWVISLQVNRMVVLLILTLIYIVLGMFMESTAMMILTTPLIYPIIISLGFDGIWFGVIMVIYVELGMITPPVGVNLYVIQGIARGSLGEVAMGTAPFVLIQASTIALLAAFPQIALWLPSQMIQRF